MVIARQPCDLVATNAKPRKGNHGYDPHQFQTMQGIFYAIGPHIQPKARVESFENVNIYPLIAKILGLPLPDQLDGSPAVLESIYRP